MFTLPIAAASLFTLIERKDEKEYKTEGFTPEGFEELQDFEQRGRLAHLRSMYKISQTNN